MEKNTYLMTLLEDEAAHARKSAAELAEHLRERAAFQSKIAARGALRDGARVRPSREGKRVLRDANRKTVVRAGPFAQSGLTLAGYYLLAAASLDEATELARDCPIEPTEAIELRPVMKGDLTSSKTEKPGKVFACAVLGNAPSEAGWIDIMNRIDDSTQHSFPEQAFVSGVRLEAPKTGRQIRSNAGQPMLLDGPFLESKEVVGGLFLMRMASMDDLVRWASDQPFVEHGTLELREVWRG